MTCDCDDKGWIVDQTYGYTDPPHDDAKLIQRCDTCTTFDGDLDAAKAFAREAKRLSGAPQRIYAIGDGEVMAPESDCWVSTSLRDADQLVERSEGGVLWIDPAVATSRGIYLAGMISST